MITKIVSGGQTGADRSALDFARRHNIEHGGWCPRGRRAEDGEISGAYCLRETPQAGYPERTEWNVRDSDGTVIFSILPILTGGSLLTAELARDYGKPCLHLSKEASDNPVRKLIDFVKEQQIEVLNVAGPRESTEPAIAKFVLDVLTRAWRELGA